MRVSSIFGVLLGLGFALASTASFAQTPPAPPVLLANSKPQCSDGIDNDGDGRVDFNSKLENGDDGCWDPSDDDERAGVPAGTSLSTSGECASSTLSMAGNTYNNCNWPNGITIAADNVTITDSFIGGPARQVRSNTTIRDSDIECGADVGSNQSGAAGGHLTRVRIRMCAWGFYATSGTFEDGAIYDHWATGAAADCHTESLLLHKGSDGPTVIQRNRLRANFVPSETCGGGFTGVVVIHAYDPCGGGFCWGRAIDKLIQYNRIETDVAGISACAYGGGTTPTSTQNVQWRNNVWAPPVCSSRSPWKIMLYYGDAGSTWVGNVAGDTLATGTPISEP